MTRIHDGMVENNCNSVFLINLSAAVSLLQLCLVSPPIFRLNNAPSVKEESCNASTNFLFIFFIAAAGKEETGTDQFALIRINQCFVVDKALQQKHLGKRKQLLYDGSNYRDCGTCG